jgi:hypothetical protein
MHVHIPVRGCRCNNMNASALAYPMSKTQKMITLFDDVIFSHMHVDVSLILIALHFLSLPRCFGVPSWTSYFNASYGAYSYRVQDFQALRLLWASPCECTILMPETQGCRPHLKVA